MKIDFTVQIPVMLLQEDKRYVAYTPVFDVSTSGKTYKETQRRFTELINIFLEELVEAGTLDQTLTSLGWNKIRRQWQPPVLVSQESKGIKIPA